MYFLINLGNQFGKIQDYLLVMDYVDGETLEEYLKKNFHNLTWKKKSDLAYQLACVVSYLHHKGITHRDLVIIYRREVVKRFISFISFN